MKYITAFLFLVWFVPSSKLHSQTDTLANIIMLGNLDVRGQNLIFLPSLKGGGERAYIFEIDDTTLGLLYSTWSSRPGYKPKVTKAFIKKSRRWRRVRSDISVSSSDSDEYRLAFCGDFAFLKDICLLYLGREKNQEGELDFTTIKSKHGLSTKRIAGKDHRSYMIRAYIGLLIKSLLILCLAVIFLRKLVRYFKARR